jgi:predicted  nucleic acid-binding Zn-ribbon protein
MIEKIWELLTTFTDESQKAALDQCVEKGFDIKRGIVSLDESFINLTAAKNVLIDAIQKKKLIQLPISIQKVILNHLESISKALANLAAGTDEVENISNYIEQLNVSIWQYGLYNLSDQVLGFLEKMNQLKTQEVELTSLKRDLQTGLKQKKALENLLDQANASIKSLEDIVVKSGENSSRTKDNLTATTQASEKAAALLATIQQNDTITTQLLSSSKTSNAEVLALEPKIKEFYSLIDQYRSKINSTTEDAQKTIKANKEETEELLGNLNMLEGQIKTQIEKATGYSLFHSFQKRQQELAKSKQFWIYALGGLVLASWAISIFVILTTKDFDTAFFGKLSMTIPLIYAIFFCTVQYGRERKLEEEYAFKSNVSISLVPYQELVEKLVDEKQEGERQKFTAFIIDAITKVYTSPTDKVFDAEHKPKGSPIDPMKQLEKVIKGVVDPLKPLFDAIKH